MSTYRPPSFPSRRSSGVGLQNGYRTAAERFRWDRLTPETRSMRDGETLIGYGMATAVYHADRAPASASATLYDDGSVVIRSAASDMGPGTYTSMTQVAADTLGMAPERVRFELGHAAMPSAPGHGGPTPLADRKTVGEG